MTDQPKLIFTSGSTDKGGTRFDVFEAPDSGRVTVETHTRGSIMPHTLDEGERRELAESLLGPGYFTEGEAELLRMTSAAFDAIDIKLRDYKIRGGGTTLEAVVRLCKKVIGGEAEKADMRRQWKSFKSELHETLRSYNRPELTVVWKDGYEADQAEIVFMGEDFGGKPSWCPGYEPRPIRVGDPLPQGLVGDLAQHAAAAPTAPLQHYRQTLVTKAGEVAGVLGACAWQAGPQGNVVLLALVDDERYDDGSARDIAIDFERASGLHTVAEVTRTPAVWAALRKAASAKYDVVAVEPKGDGMAEAWAVAREGAVTVDHLAPTTAKEIDAAEKRSAERIAMLTERVEKLERAEDPARLFQAFVAPLERLAERAGPSHFVGGESVAFATEPRWAFVEVMGHTRFVGRLVAEHDGERTFHIEDHQREGTFTKVLSKAAIFSITFVTEEEADAIAKRLRQTDEGHVIDPDLAEGLREEQRALAPLCWEWMNEADAAARGIAGFICGLICPGSGWVAFVEGDDEYPTLVSTMAVTGNVLEAARAECLRLGHALTDDVPF
jgi:hypothetical protein